MPPHPCCPLRLREHHNTIPSRNRAITTVTACLTRASSYQSEVSADLIIVKFLECGGHDWKAQPMHTQSSTLSLGGTGIKDVNFRAASAHSSNWSHDHQQLVTFVEQHLWTHISSWQAQNGLHSLGFHQRHTVPGRPRTNLQRLCCACTL